MLYAAPLIHGSTAALFTRSELAPIMNGTLIIGFAAFAAILGGAFAGVEARDRLPKQHLTDETKSLVSVSTGVVATVAALVLGLLISNANTKFTQLGGEVTALSAEILRLDHILRRYGADAEPARKTLMQYAERKTADLFPDDPSDVRVSNPSTYELLQRLEDMLLSLKAANPRDQWWLGQAMILAGKIGDTRWLIAQQSGQGTPKAFVALLVFWLALLFASFGLFAPPNLTSAVTLTLCALAVAGAVGIFLELEQGFGGIVRISPEPMRQAVKTLAAEPSNQNAP
ncbi:hypothetical protein [Bradyrhizobium arachidis]|uniref:DUF4239 domain-containing protein n=1 Tax=Bradyrhizobium arachidis TaxID=858423 RepID=A0AAE7TJS7_9BRAD|nr:hypothetical protein [Bradyrhizobium arachidis]QOZ71707.1 hypothetical protein WN72_39490 [Bradyrhizobium arachidis]SFV19169.1 hypothetical protein SAMN05192541_14646 [Bradyrhizobium arachidis]